MAQQDPGIITVVSDQPRTGPEDEVLSELARLPKFSPLVLPEAPSTFSLANVFGTLAIQDSSSSAYSAGWSSPTGSGSGSGSGTGSVFDADLLADILIQYQAHTKACFQDIQERQRILGTKIRQLDSVATQALQDLLAVQYQTRAHVDQLHFAHPAIILAATSPFTSDRNIDQPVSIRSRASANHANVNHFPYCPFWRHQPCERSNLQCSPSDDHDHHSQFECREQWGCFFFAWQRAFFFNDIYKSSCKVETSCRDCDV
ncbi:hypothetical protein BGW41_007619 [Actinomortierella wolfii]|nr:hypothetical protein BGW41_007619 [Actinomortierella wolfii]